MKKYLKIFSLALCFLFCLSILLSADYVVRNSDHVCTGKDCHICQTSVSLKKLLNSVGMSCAGSMSVICFMRLSDAVNSLFSKAKKFTGLVEDKVKLTI